MTDPLSKSTLMTTVDLIERNKMVPAESVGPFLDYTFVELSTFSKFMLRVAAYISLFFASVLVIFPEVGEWLIGVLPGFFLLPERMAKALDYIWGLVGKPVGKQHLMYHLPNIIIYAFGAAGIRQLWRKINRKNWKDRVEDAQAKLGKAIDAGTARVSFAPGFSVLFVGDGDRIGRSLVLDYPHIGPTIGSVKPPYTPLWGQFSPSEGDDGFNRVLDQFNTGEAGEYVLFPVVDQHLFLPGPQEYDAPPHRTEIAVRRIREHERDKGWQKSLILIVGDREQTSEFQTSSRAGRIASDGDMVSLNSIEAKYDNVMVADPTEITLRRIIEIAAGREILFRASHQGAAKYSKRFYSRLAQTGYEPSAEGTLTVGYDISDLETEHQVVAQEDDTYLPVILSREVYDLLSHRYLRENAHIFVPRLVKEELKRLVKANTG